MRLSDSAVAAFEFAKARVTGEKPNSAEPQGDGGDSNLVRGTSLNIDCGFQRHDGNLPVI